MHRALLLAVVAVSAGCQPPRVGMQRVSGTYALWLCSDACAARDTADAAVTTGYLVLSDTVLSRDGFPAEIIDHSMFFRVDGGRANACFRLEQRRGKPEVMAGIIPAAITSWTTSGDTVKVQLYASPDASYTLRAVLKDGRLLGVGRESGFIGSDFDKATGPAHGVRVGNADVNRCTSGPP